MKSIVMFDTLALLEEEVIKQLMSTSEVKELPNGNKYIILK